MSLREFLLDPVAIKEVSGSSRRWQTYAGRCLYAVLIGFVICTFWVEMPRTSWRSSLSDYADLGRNLFQVFFALQMVVVALGAVASAADLVTKETRAGTLGLLACSPLTPWRIAFGKWKAAMAQTSTAILCGAPILAICVFLGGATAWDLAYSFTLSVGVAALAAAVSLYCSSLFRTGIAAILVSLGALAGFAFLPALWMERPSLREFASYLTCCLHPVYAAMVAIVPWYSRAADPVLQFGWVTATLMCFALAIVLLRMTAARIRRLAVRPPSTPLLSRTFEAMDRFYENAGPARFRGIRFFDHGEVWERRAMLWKELKTRASGKLRNSVRISVVLLLLLSGIFWMEPWMLNPLIWIQAGILLLMGLASGSALFVKEKEERKWDILLATPLTAGEIVHAKVLAGLVPLLPLTAIYLLFWATLGWLHRLSLADLMMVVAVTLLPALLAFAAGAACSLRARTLRGAFLTAFGGMAGLLVALPIVISIGGYRRRVLFRCVNPVPYIDKLTDSMRGWGFMNRLSPQLQNYGDQFLVFCAVYGILTVGFLVFLRRRFDSISGRSL